MKKYIAIGILLISSLIYSQGEANNWFFGHKAGLKFDHLTGNVTNISNDSIEINTEEGCSAFSDAAGNLLFYSDGNTVWSSNHTVMEGGINLEGNASSTQSAMIIPNPANTHEYFIFTVGADDAGSESGFYYYTIDMSQNSGLGKVVNGPIDLSGGLNESWSEKVAAIRSSECYYWVLSYDGTHLKAYKVDDISGVHTTPVVSGAPAPSDGMDERGRGYLKVSPDGKKIAIAHYTSNDINDGDLPDKPSSNSSVFLYDFNDTTGVASNGIRLFNDDLNTTHPYGLEFSRQSTKLYISTLTDRLTASSSTKNSLFQYDLLSANIPNSELLIHSQNGYRGALQLAPNGKIYVTVPVNYWNGTQFLDVISTPDELGANCGYQKDAINLGVGMATHGLPPFISSIFSSIEIVGDEVNGSPLILNGQEIHLCQGDDLTVRPEPISGTVTYEWTFDGKTISNNQNLELTNIESNAIGYYNLEVIEEADFCGRTRSRIGSFRIKSVNEPPISSAIAPQIICDNNYTGTYDFNLESQFSETILNGQNSSIFEVKYYNSQTDADENKNELPTQYNTSNTEIFARIQNINNPYCFATTSFEVEIYQSALPENIIENLENCDNNTSGSDVDGIINFNLTTKVPEILNGQSETDFSITYFRDSNYSDQIPSIELTNYLNEPGLNDDNGEQTIFVRVENMLNSNCYALTSFKLKVFELPVTQEYMNFINCDGDGVIDGITDFNLDESTEYITYGDTSLLVTYHLLFNDANDNINPLNSSYFNNATASTLFARVETPEGCYKISTVELNTSTTSIPVGYNFVLDECDDDATNDGLRQFNFTSASEDIQLQLPMGQNLSIHYYRNANDALLKQNEILSQTAYMSEVPYTQIIYVRIENDDDNSCFDIGPYVTLNSYLRPEFDIISEAVVCLNLPPITLEVFNAKDDYTYEWFYQLDTSDMNNSIYGTEESIVVSKGGLYTVVATSTDGYSCQSFPQTVTVTESDVAIISQNDITITVESNNLNTVSINNENNNLGPGNYEFSLDDEYGPFQDESYFEMVSSGIHTIYVKDKNGCGLAVPLEIAILGFPNFFTPNDDLSNDSWNIIGLNNDLYTISFIYIYDRFGKIITTINPHGIGWNGYYNGSKAPSDDYWFSVQLTDKDGITRTKKGHFSLIRK